MEQFFFGEAVVLTVGKYIGIQDVHQYLGDSRRETIWRHELQTITEEYFCEIGNRDDGGKWYGTKGEFREAESKRQDRYRMNKSGDFIKNGRRCTTKNARKTALAHIRRLKGYRQTKISDIWQVWILADQHTGRETHCVVLRSGKDVPF